MAVISLNSNYYVLAEENGKPRITERYVQRQSPAYRLQGTVIRENDPSMVHYQFKDFPLGIGWDTMDRITGRGVGGVKFATADLRFGTQTLQHLNHAHTNASEADHPQRGFVHHAGEVWGFFEDDFNGSETAIVACRAFDASDDTWDGPSSGATVRTGPSAVGGRVFAVGTHKGNIIVITNDTGAGSGAGKNDSFTVLRNPDPEGSAWTEIKGTGFPDAADISGTVRDRNNFDDAYSAMVDEGNILLVALLFGSGAATDANAIRVYETPDLGANWSLTATIDGVGEYVMGFHRWRDPTDTASMTSVLVTNYNVYKIDSANNTATPLLPGGVLKGDANDGRGNAVGYDGSLYISLSTGDHLKLTILGANNLEILNIGPATGVQHDGEFVPSDGLPAAYQGHSNYLLDTPSDWLYAAYGGHAADTYATVLAYSKSHMKWYVVYDEADADIDIYMLGFTTESDGVPRLFFALEHASSAEMYHIEFPNTPVTAGQTQYYQATSYIDHPYDNHSDPHVNTGIFHAHMDAGDLTAGSGGSGGSGDEFITVSYGINDAVRTTAELGDFLSGQLTLDFPAGSTSVGISALNIGLRELLDRSSTTTKTPKRREMTVEARPKLINKKTWDFVVDIEATARDHAPTRVANTDVRETILANIDAIAESVTKLAFTVGGHAATEVIVPDSQPPDKALWIVGSSGTNTGVRTGFVTIRVEETS